MLSSRYENLGDMTSDAEMNRMVRQGIMGEAMVRHCDNIYYDHASAAYKAECDTIANTRYSQSFTALNIPGTAVLQIPNMSIVDTIAASFVINFPINVSAPRGWGYSLIDRIDYRIGSSYVLTLSGEQHFWDIMQKQETLEKKDQVMRLAGDQITAANASARANIFIDVPISRVALENHKLPFDTKLLTQPIQIIVYFKNPSSVFGGTGTLPTALSSGYFAVRQLDFKDPNHSMAEDLKIPGSKYVYPFLYQQTQVPIPFTTSTAVSGVQVALNGFRSGNLVGIGLFPLLNSNYQPQGANAALNPLDTLRMEDIKLLFNGLVLYNMTDRMHDLMCLPNNLSVNYYYNSRLTGTTTANFASVPINSYYFIIDLSQYNGQRVEGSVQSGLEIGSNTLQLSFTTPESNAAAATLFVVYYYTAGIKVSQGGSLADYIF